MISPFIVGPAVGAVIGYITNALAIRMLFRPYTTKYVFGIKVPFTPGIIPKEKGRLARSIGDAISKNLINRETLERNLLSDEMIDKIYTSVDGFFAEQKVNKQTLREFLCRYMSESEVQGAIDSISGEMSRQVGTRLQDTAIGEQVADVVIDHVTSSLRTGGLPLDIPSMLRTVIGPTLWGKIADAIQSPARKWLSRRINEMLSTKGPEIVSQMMDIEAQKLCDTPVCKLLEGHDSEITQFTDTVISMYRKLITERLPKVLEAIDIPRIVEDRINEMDMAETERLIFEVMNKELKAIIWLGAGLGFIMGFVNALI